MRKYKTSKGRYSKAKGTRAERDWRDQLRRIYPAEKRENVKRVPMSGASWMKGDVTDLNDPDTLYEVKNQETLSISAWWKQTVREAGTRTPVLVVTQNFRPFFVIMRTSDTEAFIEQAGYSGVAKHYEYNKQNKVLDYASSKEETAVIKLLLPASKDMEDLSMIKGDFYIEIKKSLTEAF